METSIEGMVSFALIMMSCFALNEAHRFAMTNYRKFIEDSSNFSVIFLVINMLKISFPVIKILVFIPMSIDTSHSLNRGFQPGLSSTSE